MKFSITYVLEKKNNRPDEIRVRMRVRWDNKLSQHLIPYTVNPKKWSKGTNRCIANTTHGKDKVSASIINREIQKYEDTAGLIFNSNNNPTVDEFKSEFDVLIGKSKPNNNSFFDVFTTYINTKTKKGMDKNI